MGTNLVLRSIVDCRMGPDISNPLRLGLMLESLPASGSVFLEPWDSLDLILAKLLEPEGLGLDISRSGEAIGAAEGDEVVSLLLISPSGSDSSM